MHMLGVLCSMCVCITSCLLLAGIYWACTLLLVLLFCLLVCAYFLIRLTGGSPVTTTRNANLEAAKHLMAGKEVAVVPKHTGSAAVAKGASKVRHLQ